MSKYTLFAVASVYEKEKITRVILLFYCKKINYYLIKINILIVISLGHFSVPFTLVRNQLCSELEFTKKCL